MSDVQKCDACGDIRFAHNSEYSFANSVTDIAADPDAVDVKSEGDLCDDCARKVAQLIKDFRRGEADE